MNATEAHRAAQVLSQDAALASDNDRAKLFTDAARLERFAYDQTPREKYRTRTILWESYTALRMKAKEARAAVRRAEAAARVAPHVPVPSDRVLHRPRLKRDEVLILIATLRSWHGVAPTHRELSEFMGTYNPGVGCHVRALQREGLLHDRPGQARALALTKWGRRRLEILVPLAKVDPL